MEWRACEGEREGGGAALTCMRSDSDRCDRIGMCDKTLRVNWFSINLCNGPRMSMNVSRVIFASVTFVTASTCTARGSSLRSARSPK